MQQTKIMLWKASVGIGALALIGCQPHVAAPQGRVQEMPVMEVDEAMQIRDWDQSIAFYQNPRFIAGPTGFMFTPAYDMPDYVYPLVETPLFVGQTLALPVTLAITPPPTPMEYAGETLEPTHHAMPPLPPPVPEGVETAMEDEPMIERPDLPPLEEPGEMTPAPMEPLPDFPEPGEVPVDRDEVMPPDAPVEPLPPPRPQRLRERTQTPPPTTQPVVRPPAPPSRETPTTLPATSPPGRDGNK